MSEQTSRAIELLNRLAERRIRAEAAAELARHWNAEAVLVLIRDEDLRVLRPALGFPQTLPGGPTWRQFLARCAEPGEYLGKVGFPTPDRVVPARAYIDDGSALVLVGPGAALSYEQFKELPFSILFALLRSEAAEQAASGLAAAAREATQRATALAGALDTARGESERNAAEL